MSSFLLSLASQNYSWPGVAKILGLPVLSEAKISDTPGSSGPRKGRPVLSPCPVNGHWEATACLGGYQQQVQNMIKTWFPDPQQKPPPRPRLAISPCLRLITILCSGLSPGNISLTQKRLPLRETAFWELRASISSFSRCAPWICISWDLVGNPDSQPP